MATEIDNNEKLYVVYCYTSVQDGHEEWADIVKGLPAAMALINKHANPWGAQNDLHLFELGKEIPLQADKVQKETVKVEEKYEYKLKEG